jgi:hypothetical protein
MLQRTGEHLEDFSDQNLLGAALLVACYQDLPVDDIIPFFQTNFGLQTADLREALHPLLQHIAKNN